MIEPRADKMSGPRRILPRAVYTARAADRSNWVVTTTMAAQPATTLLLNI